MQKRRLKNAVFISDLHLTEDRPDCTRAFFYFLDWLPASTDALFILGDFFEYWVGDDLSTELSLSVAQQLSSVADTKNIQIFFLPGNRDFSVGKDYCTKASMTLITDNEYFEVGIHKTIVCHGDLLCTDDKAYQRFRKIIRHPFIMGSLLKLPAKIRVNIAERLRQNSKKRFKRNPVYIDVTQSAVEELFNQTKARFIVHGHTHMADIHLHDIFEDKEKESSRMVLGDWHKVGWYGAIDDNGPRLHQFDILSPDFTP